MVTSLSLPLGRPQSQQGGHSSTGTAPDSPTVKGRDLPQGLPCFEGGTVNHEEEEAEKGTRGGSEESCQRRSRDKRNTTSTFLSLRLVVSLSLTVTWAAE